MKLLLSLFLPSFEKKPPLDIFGMSLTFDFEKIQCHKLYINGKFVDAIKGGSFDTINPATGVYCS